MNWRWFMILRSKGTFTFHYAATLAAATAAPKQHHKRGYKNADPSLFPILNPFTNKFETFTFHKTITGENISEVLLINYGILDSATDSGYEETDLSADSGITDMMSIKEYDSSFDEVKYDGDVLDATLEEGFFWLQLKCTATEYFYSNIFKIES